MSNTLNISRLTRTIWSLLITAIWLFLLSIVFPVFVNSLYGQKVMSLEQVLDIAEHKSVFRYQAVADNEIAQSRFKFFKTSFSPAVSLDLLAPDFVKSSRGIVQPDGSIAFQSVSQNNASINLGVEQQLKSTGGTLFFTTQLQRFDDFSLDAKQYNGIPFRVGFSQPLFGFNALKWADKIEPLALKEADRKYIIDMEDIHLRATFQYFELLTAQLNERIAKTNSDVNEKLLDIAKERFELGKTSRNDLLQLELEYKSAVKNLSAASYQVDFAKGALFTFLGQANEADIELQTPEAKESEMIVNSGLALEQARANRPEIIAFERQQQEADRDINEAKVQYGVQANLFASFGYAKGAATVGDVYNKPLSEQQLQLSVSIPLLDWGRRKAAVGIATARKELITQQITQDQLDFDNSIIQLIGQWQQLQQEIKLQEEIQMVSLDRFEISRQRYVLGDISITDLTIAQREKDQAQRDYVDTLREYWFAYFQLRKLTAYDFENNTPITFNK